MKLKLGSVILIFSTVISSVAGLLIARNISPISDLARNTRSTSQASDSRNFVPSSTAIGTYVFEELGISRKTMFLAYSDQIFAGTVVGFSPSFWDGNRLGPQTVKEWENTSRSIYHEVILKVDEPIMGVAKGQSIKVLAMGSSPVASTSKVGTTAYVFEPTDHHLKVGDQGLFFLYSQGKVAWPSTQGKSQTQQIVTFLAEPDKGYLQLQQPGRFLSNFEEDRKFQRCATTPPANVFQIKVSDARSLDTACFTRTLYTVSDIQKSLKSFDPLRTCIKPQTEVYSRLRALGQCNKKIKV